MTTPPTRPIAHAFRREGSNRWSRLSTRRRSANRPIAIPPIRSTPDAMKALRRHSATGQIGPLSEVERESEFRRNLTIEKLGYLDSNQEKLIRVGYPRCKRANPRNPRSYAELGAVIIRRCSPSLRAVSGT